MRPLPSSRITKVSPFSTVGIDYFALVFIKHQYSNRKAWVCLFVCMVTRALHMELVADMTAAEFLLDLISMLCSSIWHSDFSSVGQLPLPPFPPVQDCGFISNSCLEGHSHSNRWYFILLYRISNFSLFVVSMVVAFIVFVVFQIKNTRN